MRTPRILFYAVNGLGLGHVTRLLAIARKVRQLEPYAEIVFLTSSEAEDVIYKEGFAAFKVPSKSIRMSAQIRPATYARMVQTVTLNLISSFHPHLLIVDTFPAGTIQELLPVLRWDSRKVFVFREQRAESAKSLLMQNSLQLYDLAIIPHHEGEAYVPLPEGLDRVWTGPITIRTRDEAINRENARQALGLPTEGNIVYLTFGGGGDEQYKESMTIGIKGLLEIPNLHVAVASGPLYSGKIFGNDNVTVVDHYPMSEYFSAFDAALSATGYNSAMELLHFGVPTVFVPFSRQVDDQLARAKTIESVGAGICLEELTADGVCNAISHILRPEIGGKVRDTALNYVTGTGAQIAAEAIVKLLD